MAIDGFNPEQFAKNLTSQAVGVIPKDIGEDDKKFIVNIIYKFCVLAADALNKDEKSTLNAQQASIITQFIGEWSFHKSIDLVRAQIPIEQREAVLQEVAFAVFEEAKRVIIENAEQNEAIARIEETVKMAYSNALEKLSQSGNINKDTANRALNESNIDRMAQEAKQQQQQPQQQSGKQPIKMPDQLLKLAAISLVLRRMPQKQVNTILSKINHMDATAIKSYMQLDGLETQLDMERAQKFINEFLRTIPQEEKRINQEIASSRFHQIKQKISEETLENLLKRERFVIKSLAKEGEEAISDLSPKIVNILYNYLEGKVAGYK